MSVAGVRECVSRVIVCRMIRTDVVVETEEGAAEFCGGVGCWVRCARSVVEIWPTFIAFHDHPYP